MYRILLILAFLNPTRGPAQPCAVIAPRAFTLAVVSQHGDYDYVPDQLGQASHFQAAAEHGVTALLAHDYLSGAQFYRLAPGSRLLLIYPDRADLYLIDQVVYYFPRHDPRTEAQIFDQIYTVPGRIVLQTCAQPAGYRFALGHRIQSFPRKYQPCVSP